MKKNNKNLKVSDLLAQGYGLVSENEVVFGNPESGFAEIESDDDFSLMELSHYSEESLSDFLKHGDVAMPNETTLTLNGDTLDIELFDKNNISLARYENTENGFADLFDDNDLLDNGWMATESSIHFDNDDFAPDFY